MIMIISIGTGRIVNDFKMSRWRNHIGHTGLELRRQLWAEVKNRQGIEGTEMGGIAWEERIK